MWETTVGARVLHFHLAGINNQNFIMRDEETNSWWQQISGECVLGPLKGNRLRLFDHDELTYATWRREGDAGRVLRPDPKHLDDYAPADWETRMQRVPVATTLADPNEGLPARTLVVGVTAGGASKAYPLEALEKQKLIVDQIGAAPVLVLLAEDGKSVRVFDRGVEGGARPREFFLKPDTHALLDAETGSEWDFTGAATSGPLDGVRLKRLQPIKDYWFDWKKYHPDTGVYLLGER